MGNSHGSTGSIREEYIVCPDKEGGVSAEMGGCPQETGESVYPFSSCPLGVPRLGPWASSLSPVSSAWDLGGHLWEAGPTYDIHGPASPQDGGASQALVAGGEALAPADEEMPKTLPSTGTKRSLTRSSKSPAAPPPSC